MMQNNLHITICQMTPFFPFQIIKYICDDKRFIIDTYYESCVT